MFYIYLQSVYVYLLPIAVRFLAKGDVDLGKNIKLELLLWSLSAN